MKEKFKELQRDKIAGFDFDKMVVLIHTGNTIENRIVHGTVSQISVSVPVYEQQSITNDEMEVIKDAWLDYRYTKDKERFKSK